MTVRISVRDSAGVEIGSTDLMEHTYQVGNTHTLQQDVFAGVIDPGNLVAVREIRTPTSVPADCGVANPLNCDTAVFSGPLSNYTIESVPAAGTADAFVRVTQTGADVATQKVSDGIDSVRNIERLQFSDGPVLVAAPAAPALLSVVPGTQSATVNFSFAGDTASLQSFTIVATPTAGPAVTTTGISRTATSRVVTGLTAGVEFTFQVFAVSIFGSSGGSNTATATPTAPVVLVPPAAPTIGTATAGNAQATVTWTPPAPNGGPAITSYELVTTPATIGPITGIASGATSRVVTGLTNGVSYTFRVRAVNADGTGPLSAASNAVTPVAPLAPLAPTIGTATRGNATATVTWTDGARPVTNHNVQIFVAGVLTATRTNVGAGSSAVITGLTNGTTYRFRVVAVNAVGPSPASGASNAVTPATLPGAPVIGLAERGALGGNTTALARWAAPASNGGSPILNYRVSAYRVVLGVTSATATATTVVSSTTRQRSMQLPAGTYRFRVVAVNALGQSLPSALSNAVLSA